MNPKHITIEPCEDAERNGHHVIMKRRPKDCLGEIYYKKRWKKHVFAPLDNSEWSSDCLEPIIIFLKDLDKKRGASK
jgi:hypothetical protein